LLNRKKKPTLGLYCKFEKKEGKINKNMKSKLTILTALVGLSMLVTGRANAYETDTHFTLTYTMCVAVGMSEPDALIVAMYDQGMDDSVGTVANTVEGAKITIFETNEILWHAIPQRASATTVLARKQELWNLVLAESDRTKKLQRLGVFFHYQQDTWAHRKHPNSDARVFDTYEVPLGHGLERYQPDRPPFDGVCALRCLEEGINYVKLFQQNTYGGIRPLLKDYTPASGEEDGGGTNGRRGQHIHQLASDGSTPGRKFVTDLIREQINAYNFSTDLNPNYFGRDTANEADYLSVRQNLQGVCQRNNIPINIPMSRPTITTLTTAALLVPPTPIVPVAPTNENVAITGSGAIRGTIRFGTDIAADNTAAQEVVKNLRLTAQVRTGMSGSAGAPGSLAPQPVMTKIGVVTYKEATKNNNLWEVAYEVRQLPIDVPIEAFVSSATSSMALKGVNDGWEGKITITPVVMLIRRFKKDKESCFAPPTASSQVDPNQIARVSKFVVPKRKNPTDMGSVGNIDFTLVPNIVN
jgi:hypothetical protein